MTTKTFNFEQFLQHGREQQPEGTERKALPWHFKFFDGVVTHERDDLYLLMCNSTDYRITPTTTIKVADDKVTSTSSPIDAQAAAPAAGRISPTIGRRLWYWPSRADERDMVVLDRQQPLDAGVVYVHKDGTINLDVCDHEGFHRRVLDVTLVQGSDATPAGEGYAAWMPYQLGQAKKA